MKIRGIILDMDGTMFDTERISKETWKRVADEEGILPLSSFPGNWNGIGQKEAEAAYKRFYGDRVDYWEMYRRKSRYMNEILEREGVPVKKGLYEFLDAIRQEGYRLALGTSSNEAYARHCLELSHTEEYFDVIISGNMVEHCKPSPEIFEKAAGALGLKAEECAVVEDSINGIQAALNGGFLPIMIPDRKDLEIPFDSNEICLLNDLTEVMDVLRKYR